MEDLSHVNKKGEARMVDVSQKDDTMREAVVTGRVRMQPATLQKIKQNQIKKGDVLSVARVAGIMAAKKTPELIPMCHPIIIDNISIELDLEGDDYIKITAMAKSSGKTGVEMEALVAANVAAMTIYDMCKAVDRGMVIEQVSLKSKSGGKSGTYKRGENG